VERGRALMPEPPAERRCPGRAVDSEAESAFLLGIENAQSGCGYQVRPADVN